MPLAGIYCDGESAGQIYFPGYCGHKFNPGSLPIMHMRAADSKTINRSKSMRSLMALLGLRDFRIFYLGYATSLFGSAMAPIAITFAVLGRGGTPAQLGYVMAAGVVPQVFFMIGGGVLADRLGRRKVMLGTDTGRLIVQATLAAALFAGPVPVWVFVVLSALRGTGEAFFSPALGGLRADIAPRERLHDANALLSVVDSGSRVIGPGLAGVLIAVLSPAAVIAADAATFGVSVLALSLLHVPAVAPPARTARGDLAEGWAAFRAQTWICLTTVQWALLNLLTYAPYILLGPVLAQQFLGGARAWGLIGGAQAAGAVLTGLALVGRRVARPALASVLGTVAVPLPCVALALHGPVAGVAGAAFVAGAGIALSGTFWASAMQQRIQPALYSRITAFNITGAFTLGSVGLAVVGPVAAAIGAGHLLAFAGGWGLASGAAVCCLPVIWRVRWLDPPAAGRQPPAG
jgi:MFS family permease